MNNVDNTDSDSQLKAETIKIEGTCDKPRIVPLSDPGVVPESRDISAYNLTYYSFL
jgi:hypothetical protein